MDVRSARVLVTGASGFIGSHVVAALRSKGADVHTVSLRAVADLEKAVSEADPERVVHLGGFTDIGASWTDPAACFAANVDATLALLGALRGSSCQRVVYVSTADVYGNVAAPFREGGPVNPLSPYAVSKWAAERVCAMAERTGGPPCVVVRPFNVYGPGQPDNRLVADVILTALRGEDVAMTQGLQRREANFVTDIADGVVAATFAEGVDGEVLNLGNGDAITVRSLAERILSLMGNPVTAHFGAKPERPVEVPVVEADTSRARELLGWSPTQPLDDGLRETIRWYRARALSVSGDER